MTQEYLTNDFENEWNHYCSLYSCRDWSEKDKGYNFSSLDYFKRNINLMKYKIQLILAFAFFASLSISAQDKFDGLWGGTIITSGIEVEVNFEIQTAEKRILLSVPIQKINDQVGSGIEIKGDSIFFDYSNFNASYEGQYDADKKEIIGEWMQGKKTALNLKRIEKKAELVRNQVVKRPYPYKSENLKFHNEKADIDLAGVLTTPEGDGPFPLAILISGSGPQDRNSELLGHKPFLVIADHLTRNGIAVLRYDDRGVKNSGGSFTTSTSADFATDAEAAIAFGLTLPNIDQSKIGLVGHSEGGLIAPLVASRNEEVDFIVSIAGPAIPISELMTIQNKMIFEKIGMSEDGLTVLEDNLPKIYSIVNQDKEPKELFDTLIDAVKVYYNALPEEDQKLLGPSSSAYYTAISTTFFTPWFRHFLAYDPGPSWQKVTCPVLALNGSEDIQVSAKENLEAIKKHLTTAKNKNHTEIELEGFNHLMQPCKVCSINEYVSIPTTFDPQALDLITNFVKGLQ